MPYAQAVQIMETDALPLVIDSDYVQVQNVQKGKS